ncbi:hypothetical protein [Bacillus cereus]|uniref:hypothetical protein n=1 Tax=Bacillus cereus TaxID=1396 RepID=UPI003012DFC6
MQVIISVVVILIFVYVDYCWLDMDGKRWGWFKGWSKQMKLLFIVLFVLLCLVSSFVVNWHYLKNL